MNFYIKAVDNQLRKNGDNQTIGLLLCKSRDKLVAEYALSDIKKPIGVSEYKLTHKLPKDFKSSLPTIEEIEREFAGLKAKGKKKQINLGIEKKIKIPYDDNMIYNGSKMTEKYAILSADGKRAAISTDVQNVIDESDQNMAVSDNGVVAVQTSLYQI